MNILGFIEHLISYFRKPTIFLVRLRSILISVGLLDYERGHNAEIKEKNSSRSSSIALNTINKN